MYGSKSWITYRILNILTYRKLYTDNNKLLTDLDASLPLEVDAPQFGVVVNSCDIRLGRFADEFVCVEYFLAVSFEVSYARSHLALSALAFTARAAAVHHGIR